MEDEAGVKRVDEVESHLALDCAEVTVLRGNNDDDAGRSVVFEAVRGKSSNCRRLDRHKGAASCCGRIEEGPAMLFARPKSTLKKADACIGMGMIVSCDER